MPQTAFDRLIINSPYEEPKYHREDDTPLIGLLPISLWV